MKISARGLGAALVVVVVAGVCVRLGFWQLHRLAERREHNAALTRALALPPLPLAGDSLAALLRDPARFRYRRVRARGVYDPAQEVVLRGRSQEGAPGVHLVTPMRIAGSPYTVLVDRGWAPAQDAVTLDPRPLAEPGPREVEGLLLEMPQTTQGGLPLWISVAGTRVLTLQRLDPTLLHQRLGRSLLPLYVQQLPGPSAPAGPPIRAPLPELSEGPHLSYALQWFSFAAIAIIGSLVFFFRGDAGRRDAGHRNVERGRD